MSSLPGSAISIADGEITIDAELLSSKLGLSASSLKAKMRRGVVSSVAETGIDEDVGRTRLTFRYHSRAWTVVVNPDGNLVECIAPPESFSDEYRWFGSERFRQEQSMTASALEVAAMKTVEDSTPETLALQLRAYLQALATRCLPITYREAAKGIFLLPPNTIHKVTEALEQLMGEDAAADRPFIAAMVISKTRGGLPAPGFFDCAARLGRFASDGMGLDASAFHTVEINAAFAFWGQSSEPPRE